MCIRNPSTRRGDASILLGFVRVRAQLCALISHLSLSDVVAGSFAHSSVPDEHVAIPVPAREVKNVGGLPSGP